MIEVGLDELVAAARAVRAHAYAPYSRYLVGAAVRGGSGALYAGGNVENAAYGLSLCAERSAVAQAIAAGETRLLAAAVVTAASPPASPCGMCRQVLAEFGAATLPIRLANETTSRDTSLGALLPEAFGPASLG